MPDDTLPDAHSFETKAQARRYVLRVASAMLETEDDMYGHTATGWFLDGINGKRTRRLIREAVADLVRDLRRRADASEERAQRTRSRRAR